jgi:hypothetical protein
MRLTSQGHPPMAAMALPAVLVWTSLILELTLTLACVGGTVRIVRRRRPYCGSYE